MTKIYVYIPAQLYPIKILRFAVKAFRLGESLTKESYRKSKWFVVIDNSESEKVNESDPRNEKQKMNN
jgi:hypothetical protein